MARTVNPTPIAAVMGTPVTVQLTLDGPDSTTRGGHNLQWVVSDPTRGAFAPVDTVVPLPLVAGNAVQVTSTFTPAAVTAGPVTLDLVDTDDMNTVVATVPLTVAAAAAPGLGAGAGGGGGGAGAGGPGAAGAGAGGAGAGGAGPGAGGQQQPPPAQQAQAQPGAQPAANAAVAGGMVFHAPVNGGVHVGGADQQAGAGLGWQGKAFAAGLFIATTVIMLLLLAGALGWIDFGKDPPPAPAAATTSTDRVEIPRAVPVTIPDPVRVEVTIRDGDQPPRTTVAAPRVVYVGCSHAPDCD